MTSLMGIAMAAVLGASPVADAFVRYDQQGANFGSSAYLRAGYSHEKETRSFLRFEVARAGHATLRIYVERGNGGTVRVYAVANDTWSEGGITWRNQPALGSQVGTFPATRGWHSVHVPVSAGLNSFALRKYQGPSDPGPVSRVGRDEVCRIASSESNHPPELVT